MIETKSILILSKATLLTGGLEALRARIYVYQIQKCFRFDSLAANCAQASLLSIRQGFQPNR